MQSKRWGSMEGKRPMQWQRRKSRGVLSQGRERRENKVFGIQKREARTKQRDKELKKEQVEEPWVCAIKVHQGDTRMGFGNAEYLMAPASSGLHQSPSAAWNQSVNSRELLFIFEEVEFDLMEKLLALHCNPTTHSI